MALPVVAFRDMLVGTCSLDVTGFQCVHTIGATRIIRFAKSVFSLIAFQRRDFALSVLTAGGIPMDRGFLLIYNGFASRCSSELALVWTCSPCTSLVELVGGMFACTGLSRGVVRVSSRGMVSTRLAPDVPLLLEDTPSLLEDTPSLSEGTPSRLEDTPSLLEDIP